MPRSHGSIDEAINAGAVIIEYHQHEGDKEYMSYLDLRKRAM
jgi:hypothetical protein